MEKYVKTIRFILITNKKNKVIDQFKVVFDFTI